MRGGKGTTEGKKWKRSPPPSPPPCACPGLWLVPSQSRPGGLVEPHVARARRRPPARVIPCRHSTRREEGPSAVIPGGLLDRRRSGRGEGRGGGAPARVGGAPLARVGGATGEGREGEAAQRERGGKWKGSKE